MQKRLTRIGRVSGFFVLFLVCAMVSLVHAGELGEVSKAVKEKKARWSAKDTAVSKLRPEDRKRRLGGRVPAPTGQEKIVATPYSALPAALDWRNYGGSSYVTPIKDQGACGSCWAFATTAALESSTLISKNMPGIDLDLSEQTALSCSGAGSCYGGLIDSASDFISNIGLPSEGCFPYLAIEGGCVGACSNWQGEAYKIDNWYKVEPTVDAVKHALYNYGPLVTLIAVHTDFFYYSSGIYTHSWGSFEGYHAAAIVGYNDAEQYFIVKSSWGTDWGESGYFMIAYSEVNGDSLLGHWTIAYENPVPADFPSLDGIPRDTDNSNPGGSGNGQENSVTSEDAALLIGAVRDEKGVPLAGAEVKSGNYSSITNVNGQYRIGSIPVGSYVVTVRKTGYVTLSENVIIPSTTAITKDFTLTFSPASDSSKDKDPDGKEGPNNPKNDTDNQDQAVGPGWFKFEADPVSHEEAEAYFSKRRAERQAKLNTVPLAASGISTTTEIQELARALKYDPKLIYDYVHNYIDYIPYFGFHKGATATLLDGKGNDFDQASLMVALLRESGRHNSSIGPVQYVYGRMTIPGRELASWLGVEQDTRPISLALQYGGIPFTVISTWGKDIGTSSVSRVWVKATVNGTEYLFDPAFKTYIYKNKSVNIGEAMGYDQSDFLAVATAGATVGSDYVQHMNEANIRSKLATYSTNLSNHIRAQYPNSELKEIIGGRTILRTELQSYSSALPFTTTVSALWDDIPLEYTAQLNIRHLGIDHTFNTPDLNGGRLTLTYSNGYPQIRLDGVVQVTGSTYAESGYYNDFKVYINHPYVKPFATYADQTVTFKAISGSTYAVFYSFGTLGDGLLHKRQQQLESSQAQGLSDSSEAVLGETLNVMGLTWIKEVMLTSDLLSELNDTLSFYHHIIGMVAQETGYYIDVPAAFINTRPRHNAVDNSSLHFHAIALISSAYEHGILEQLMGSDKPGLSTIKLLQIANATGERIFKVTSENTYRIDQLKNYSSEDRSYYKSKANSGYTFILPENGSLGLDRWKGKGYISLSSGSMGMIIGGEYYGGYCSARTPVHIPTVTRNVTTAQWSTSSPKTINKQVTTAPPRRSKDPVDMASGAFLYDHTDIDIGDEAPLGLSLVRSYNSSQSLQKRPVGYERPLGYGWTHSYDIYLVPSSNADPGLGKRQAVDAASLIAALYATADIMKSRNDKTGWVTASLTSKWAIDQLIDNTVTVYMGSKTLVYVQQADGTFSAPPGITAQLVKNGDGTYNLKERFGTRIDFNASKKVSRLTDGDGNAMTFSYDGGNNLSKVIDAFGRSLNFEYSGSRIGRVYDMDKNSASYRSVYYGYDVNGDLTSYTDPEGKIWRYGYANHLMTTLINPLAVTTATNTYDALGRVKTQAVPRQGVSNAVYNFYFSGYRSVEEDPDGNTLVDYYDHKGRTILQINELGRRTYKRYDGQNHVTVITDPRSGSARFPFIFSVSYLYDGNQNLEKAINPLGYTVTNVYDSQFRLTATIDPLEHTTHFEYDAEHHLIQTRDALGNTAGSAYYANGLKESATDARAIITALTYDTYGNPRTTKTAARPAVTYTYDFIGRMTELRDQVGSSTSFVYDKRGLLKEKTDPLGRKTLFGYDDAGRLTSITDRNSAITTFAYTATDKVERITYHDGSTVTLTYDKHDRLVRMSDPTGAASYSYDAAGQLTSHTNTYGFTVKYKYDEAGNLIELTYPGDKKVLYFYDVLNHLVAVVNWLDQVASYTYDEAGRVTAFTGFNGIETVYSYDAANRLTGFSSPIAQYHFALDGNGNRVETAKIEPLTPLLDKSPVMYGYNDPKRNRLLSAGANSYGYDNEGQLTTINGAAANTFDHEHRLTRAGTSQYFYDGSDSRLRAVRNGVETRYIYDAAGNLLAEADGNNVITRYYLHGMGLIAMVEPSAPADRVYCYHFDAIGSTVGMTDESQTMVNRYAYDEFGTVANQQETVYQPFTFVGQFGVMTEPNGYYYMRARYYDPQVGRFISEDPIGFDGGDINLYQYVGANPVNFTDPSGLLPNVDPNKPFDRFNPNNLKDNSKAINALKNTLDKIKFVNKAIEWTEKTILKGAAAKLLGATTYLGILLHPDVANENEDAMLRNYYNTHTNSRCSK
ncbi:MAG: C1 family peptidase [Nitrospirota bacterium]